MLKHFPQLIVHLKVMFWYDRVPKMEIWISEHSVFPSVYIQVRQQGAWKLHLYNFNAQKPVFYHKVCPFGSI